MVHGSSIMCKYNVVILGHVNMSHEFTSDTLQKQTNKQTNKLTNTHVNFTITNLQFQTKFNKTK